MHLTSHHLNTVLALLLGITGTLAFHSSDAVGYPTAAISTGANPVLSAAGAHNTSDTATLFAAEETDVVVTDVVLTMSSDDNEYCMVSFVHSLQLSDGTKVGEFAVGMHSPASNQPTVESSLSASFESGIRLPAGDTLSLHTDLRYKAGCGDATVHYTVAGYRAQP